ncbi:MAG: ATP-dependent helicase [Anaerolineae bacterium]|nr:ATP-dependent helicase [Anaerolineae bacterium]
MPTLTLRPEQANICAYDGGMMAVSAVPGSGKTFTLAALALQLLKQQASQSHVLGNVQDEREILIVTFTTSAVDNIRSRIRRLLADEKMPDAGYRVLTLHGLAHLILRQRPDLAGMSADFQIDDELSGGQAMTDAVRWFTHVAAPDFWQSFVPEDLSAIKRERALDRWRDSTERIAREVTRLAKNLRLTPKTLLKMKAEGERMKDENSPAGSSFTLHPSSFSSPFLDIGIMVYERYEKILNLGGRLDFDDLIWRAITALENDAGFRAKLRQRWWVILEDEAQDSTPLQEVILNLITRDGGDAGAKAHARQNWVRVGDPNQAIMTTFTASDARFFREFTLRPDVKALPLSQSGRSAQRIIDMANWLARWAVNSHPEPEVRQSALSDRVQIHPTSRDDTQPNPPDDKAIIHVETYATSEEEAAKTAYSAVRYMLRHRQRLAEKGLTDGQGLPTCAILVPTNAFGDQMVAELALLEAKYSPGQPIFQDQLKNTQAVRNVADVLAKAVKFCSTPTSVNALIDLREALIALNIGVARGNEAADKRLKTLLRSAKIERLLFPSPLKEAAISEKVAVSEKEMADLAALAERAAKWVRASVLPIDQIMLTIAQDLLTRKETANNVTTANAAALNAAHENDLAIAHSLAVSMRRFASINPSAQLGDLAQQLDEIASNRTKYLSNSLIESGFAPVPGLITVTTMHKAKGLEWDRVYLTSVDMQEYPHHADSNDWRGQVWFLGGRDPATEARKALEAWAKRPADVGAPLPSPDQLIREARLEYIAERLRLLYVGITRAKTDLQISFSRKRGENPRDYDLALPIQLWLRA